MTDEDVALVLMAIANLEGIWDRLMRIPEPSRVLLIEQEHNHWKVDKRGYPLPSKALLNEIRRLEEMQSGESGGAGRREGL